MSGYRRFVTYLFQYENGRKESGCGFAKMEARQGRCRMELQLKGCMDGVYTLYLFHAAKRGPVGVRIGEIRVRGGIGREIFIFAAEAVGESPYTLDDMNGIRLNAEGGGFIASQWDDAEVDFREFRVYGAGAAGRNAEEYAENRESEREEYAAEDESDREEYAENRKSEREEFEENRMPEREKSEENQRQRNTETICSEAHENRANIKREPGSGSDSFAEDATPEIKATQAASCAIPEYSYSNPITSDPGYRSKTAAAELSSYMSAWEKQWKRFSASHPVFCPFDDAQNVYAVKTDLRDLRILPKEYHSLANNSFLLHGYFNYRYLLFGYMDAEDAKRWFLGVPGVFQNQEQLMAGIFGFPEFRSKSAVQQKNGAFGFWYRYLDL